MTFERKNFVVSGVNLETKYYAGQPELPTLIFLHEGLGCIDMWRDFPQKLSELTGCPTFIYSRCGYGGSDPCIVPRPLTYMQNEGLEVLPELIKVAGIKQHVLIGHSDGGSIALINAGGKPTPDLRGLVTMAPHVFCENLSVSSIEKARLAFVEGNLREGLAKYHHDNTDCAFWGWNKAWLDPDFMRWNIEEHLSGIEVPQLVIQGNQDPYGTIAQVESIKRQSKGKVEVCMFDDCAHAPYKEKPLQSLAMIDGFLRGIQTLEL